MKNNPIQVLLKEHEVISKLEQVIISLNDQWEKNEENYERTVIDICDFIQKYSDGYHHHKELKS